MQINSMLRIITGLLIAFSCANSCFAQGTAKSKTVLGAEVSSDFPDQNTGAITPAITRGALNDFVASWQQAPLVNAQVGTTYTFLPSDYGQLVTFCNSGAVAVVLPQATGSFAPWNTFVENKCAVTVTITPTTSTINGISTLQLSQGQSALIISDSVNYQVWAGSPGASSVTNAMLAQMPADTIKGNNTAALSNPVDMTVSQFKTLTNAIISIADPAYGAVNDCVTDNTSKIQAAINAITSGGIIYVPGSCYAAAGPITITKPVTIVCAPFSNSTTGNINATSTTGDLFDINSSFVTFRGCYLNGQGSPSTSRAIAVGTDAISITDAGCNTGTSTTLTSTSQSNWTSSNVGNRVNLAGAGVGGVGLFATITAVGGAHSATITPGCSTTVTAANASYGNVYIETILRDVYTYNFNKGVHFINAAQFHVDHLYSQANIAMHVQNTLAPDYGDSFLSNSTLIASGTSAGQYGLFYQSSGGLKGSNNKLLNGQYAIYQNWNVGLSGDFIWTGGSIENCGTNAMFFSNAFQFNNVVVTGTEINCGAPNIAFDNSSTSIVNIANITGVNFSGGGGTAISAGKVTNLNAVGNPINTGGGNPAISVSSNCTGCLFSANSIVAATVTYSNASTTARIDDTIGMASASLPSAAAAGSRIFVTDGTPGSASCAGSGTGSTGFRQNGAWKCF